MSASRSSCRSSLVEVIHQGVLVATHAERRAPRTRPIRSQGPVQGHAHPASTGLVVTRRVDPRGTTSFAGTTYAVGMRFAGQMVQVAIVANSVQISSDGPCRQGPRHPSRPPKGARCLLETERSSWKAGRLTGWECQACPGAIA